MDRGPSSSTPSVESMTTTRGVARLRLRTRRSTKYAAGVGTAVTLWGEGLSADEVAAHAGTVSYELMCAVAPRVTMREI